MTKMGDARDPRLWLLLVFLTLTLFASGAHAFSLCYVESLWTKIVRTLLIIPLFLYALLNKLAAMFLGAFLLLLSLVPIPRLGQWCPPTIAIFDGLLALTCGIILYVLILMAFVGEESNAKKKEEKEANLNMKRHADFREREGTFETRDEKTSDLVDSNQLKNEANLVLDGKKSYSIDFDEMANDANLKKGKSESVDSDELANGPNLNEGKSYSAASDELSNALKNLDEGKSDSVEADELNSNANGLIGKGTLSTIGSEFCDESVQPFFNGENLIGLRYSA